MQTKTGQMRLLRSNKLLFRKFLQFLLPTMITYAAVSLNEFADSMLVSRLLGSEAMAIVGLGMPLMLAMAGVYSLLGSGGATAYAMALGRRDHEAAGENLTAAVLVSLAVGLLFLILGNLFFGTLSKLLCRDAALRPQFARYLRILLLSSPFLIVILTLVSFFPAAGHPGFTTAVNVTANVVNIVMDYVYIRVFGMGVEGAAWATLTGYLAALLLVLLAFAFGKIKLDVSRHVAKAFGTLREITKLGRPDALTQIGLSLQFAVGNNLAAACAGADAVVAYSLCIQSCSIISIFWGAMIGSSVPILAVLHGQRDYRGQNAILKTAMLGQTIVAVTASFAFIVFARSLAALYNITEPGQAALAVHALRVFSLMYVFRSAVILYFRYLKVIGLTRYASWLSALDGFAAIVPAAWLMVRLFGINGLWWAYPLTEGLLFLSILLYNRRCAAASDGRLRWPLLTEHDVASEPVLDVTITKDASSIVGLSQTLQALCEENGLDSSEAVRAALAVEEMGVYAANKKKLSSFMDVLIRMYKGDIEIEFRSLGAAFDPNTDVEGDMRENVQVLRSVAGSIHNEYILGMNSTRIVIEGARPGGEEQPE